MTTNPVARNIFWAAWVHRRVKFGPIRTQEVIEPELIDADPERKINTVCHPCNNTWMSRLEEKNIPVVGSMLMNTSTVIDTGRQRLFNEWAVKTAMVMDSIKEHHDYEKFYTRDECFAMRISWQIPKRTRIWIGALAESHLGAFGTDFTIRGGNGARIGMGTANTIIIGHFAVQVVTIHTTPEYAAYTLVDVQPKPGDWDNMVIQVEPRVQKQVNWPPKVVFTNGGRLSIALLMDRWRSGEKVSKITKDIVVS